MFTCKDCLGYDFCPDLEKDGIKTYSEATGIIDIKELCRKFVNKENFAEIKDCCECRHLSKHGGAYPCSHCRHCRSDMFEPKGRKADFAPSLTDVLRLREKTGCGLALCRDALRYAEEYNGGESMAIAYCKAKTLAVNTKGSFHDRVKRFMNEER